MRCIPDDNGGPCKVSWSCNFSTRTVAHESTQRCRSGGHECIFEESNRGKRSTRKNEALTMRASKMEAALKGIGAVSGSAQGPKTCADSGPGTERIGPTFPQCFLYLAPLFHFPARDHQGHYESRSIKYCPHARGVHASSCVPFCGYIGRSDIRLIRIITPQSRATTIITTTALLTGQRIVTARSAGRGQSTEYQWSAWSVWS